MTGVIATLPKFQFSNALGIPLFNGTLEVYLAGTNTPTNTWQNQGLSILNTNPINLDSRGECVLWLSSSVVYKFVLKNALGVTQWTVDNVSGADAAAELLRADLALSSGSSLVGFVQSGAGAVATTIQAKLRESVSILDFGAVGDGITDNTASFAAAAAYIASFSGTNTLPELVFPSGTYNYVTSPNWSVTNLTLKCSSGVIFKHTGSGNAFVFDGGATGPGKFRVSLVGAPIISGNALSTNGIYVRATHHSSFDAFVRDVSVSGLSTSWTVCNEYRIRCSPLGFPSFSPTPVSGMYLDGRGVGEQTSACTFYNPILEGVSGYGINVNDGILNTFIGGTSEANGGGVTISAASSLNNFIGLDMEFNSVADITCLGSYNKFDTVLSSTTSRFDGAGNLCIAGVFNTINNTGYRNEFIKTTYASNTGAFTDGGTETIKRSVRNATSNTLDPELVRNPNKLICIDGPVGNNTVIGSDDQIGGGSVNDVSFFHYGPGEFALWVNGFKRIRMDTNGVGFQGSAAIAKPTVSGSKGGNAALASLLTALAAYGLITDSTS